MLFMLHGAVGHFRDWHSFSNLLDGYDSNAVDLYAKSDEGLDSYAERLNSTASLGDALIGYSMGGRLALHSLVHPSSKWSRAVIISAHPGLAEEKEKSDRKSSDLRWVELLNTNFDLFLQKWAQQPVFGGHEMSCDKSRKSLSPENIQRCFTSWSLGGQRNLAPELENLQIPVLWITGEKDAKFTEIARKVTVRMPDCRLEVIPGSGHRCPWEQPELTASLIRSFLSA